MSADPDLMTRLGAAPLFQGLENDELACLAEVVDEVTVDAGHTVLRQGEYSDELYVIAAGTAEVSVLSAGERSHVISFLGPGDHFGEISLLTSHPCIASVVASSQLNLMRLRREALADYLAWGAQLRGQLLETSVLRAGTTLEHVIQAANEGRAVAPFNQLLRRLIDHQVDAMRAAEMRGEPVTFAEVVQFYGSTRFLYPAKLGVLEARFGAVRETWARLIAANGDLFKILMLRRVMGEGLEVKNSICAFEFAPGTWQVQHLVSADRHEYSGTLASVIGIIDWIENTASARCIRLSYRPDNPGTARLFDAVARSLPLRASLRTVSDYYVAKLGTTPDSALPHSADRDITVRGAEPGDQTALRALYARTHPALPEWLSVADPPLHGLDARYRTYGLHRSRQLLVALHHGQIAGTVACWFGSEGINFSFLENTIEDLYIDESLPFSEQARLVALLLQTAVHHYQTRKRTIAVGLLETRHRTLIQTSGILPAPEKQYALLTVGRTENGFGTSRNIIEGHYSELLRSQASAEGIGDERLHHEGP